jgi:hypothetical protein
MHRMEMENQEVSGDEPESELDENVEAFDEAATNGADV